MLASSPYLIEEANIAVGATQGRLRVIPAFQCPEGAPMAPKDGERCHLWESARTWNTIQGYLAHEKTQLPRTLPEAYA